MTLFDSYLVVDWSASSVPKLGRDSIWSALIHHGAPARLDNHPTRHGFEDWLAEVVPGCGRLLAGFDFSFATPAGLAAAIGADGAVEPWASVWATLAESIADTPRNANNRFEVASWLNGRVGDGPGPFWGCPIARETEHLSMRKAPGFPHRGLEEYRRCELLMHRSGHRVFSTWQLAGAGSVGSQSLMGIPMLHRLRASSSVPIEVWPFTTGLRAPAPRAGEDSVVVAEVWPSWIEFDLERHPVRDACQVLTLVDYLSELDRDGGLSALMSPSVAGEERRVAETEEGWILGAVP